MKETPPASENITTAYERVGARLFSLNLPPEVYETAADLEIVEEIDFDWEGKIDESFENSLYEQLKTVGLNDADVVSGLAKEIRGVVGRYVKECQREEALVYVRVTTPNESFNVPRWHRDGNFFKESDKEEKLVFRLKGALSLIGKAISPDDFNEEESHLNKMLDNKNLSDPDVVTTRKKMAQNVKSLPSPAFGQGVVFSVGGIEATIHSEPPLSESRIFVSVVIK
jgi:hypothetical protein